jgi:hypothetical protein
MRNIFWLVGTALIFSNAMAVASSQTQCKAFEFAEMQTMSKTELTELYCTNKKTMELARKLEIMSVKNYLTLVTFLVENPRASKDMHNLADKNSKEATMFDVHAKACATENNRVLRLLKKDDPNFATPNCLK